MNTTDTAAKTLAEQTVCIDLAISFPGTHRKVAAERVNKTDAEDQRLSVRKKVLDSKKLTAVHHAMMVARSFMKSVALPIGIYRGGLYPISMARLVDVPEQLDKFRDTYDAAVTAFLDEYAPADGSESELIKADRAALKSLFETSDYPSRAKMKEHFSFEYYIIAQATTPEVLKAISPAMFSKEKKRTEDRLKAAADELVAGLRVRFRDLVAHMVDRLTPNATGDRKRFHSANVEKLSEFLKNLAGDNVLGDAEISTLADRASKMLDGLDTEALRKDGDYQQQVLNDFDGLKTQLDALAADGGRSFDFGDEQ